MNQRGFSAATRIVAPRAARHTDSVTVDSQDGQGRFWSSRCGADWPFCSATRSDRLCPSCSSRTPTRFPVVSIADSRPIADRLRESGFVWAAADQVRASLPPNALRDWSSFAASWNDLGVDAYMADSGRYRRRRFSVFTVSAHGIVRKPHQPHYQSRDYNPLNGGIERWFQPFLDSTADHAVLRAILEMCFSLFQGLTPPALRPPSWHVECHQFRIEARVGEEGRPTPEGLHRDGVDWVLVMLVARENIAEGVTSIHDSSQTLVGEFTLTEPLDSAFVDDSRVFHGVTPVAPLDPAKPAYRDVLVVTFRRE
jgi:hypothetical protein